MSFKDAGHRPHGVHMGESPEFSITHGPESISVTLDQWGPEDFHDTMFDYLQSNWGDRPANQDWFPDSQVNAYLDACFGGRTLQQVLEGITFWFTVNGVTRAMTHEMVRARFAAFMQHGGRDNDWRHRDWTMPETMRRVFLEVRDAGNPNEVHCLVPGHRLSSNIETQVRDYLHRGKELYAALVDAGIPWQDARRLLPIGTQTYIHGIFNYISLRDFLGNRMEFIMDWEINCVAQLMYREVRMKCPPLLSKYLGSHSDRQGRAAFAGLESWPPDGKYYAGFPCWCGHPESTHVKPWDGEVEEPFCTTCAEQLLHGPHEFKAADPSPRTHRREQNPFWVLAQSSLDGGPVKWIPTNGTYPHDHPDAPKPRTK